MRTHGRYGLWIAIALFVLSAHAIAKGQQAQANVQTQSGATKLKLTFKIFDANDTSVPIDPFSTATIHYRAKVLGNPDVKFDLPVHGPDGKGLYYVEVDRGWLIDRLVIRAKRPDTNPAVILKVVTNADMTVYPGASHSTASTFTFHSYVAQMNAYRDIYTQFVEESPLSSQQVNLANLVNAFSTQLKNMADIRKRVSVFTEKEFATMVKVRNEVLEKYGLASVGEGEVNHRQVCHCNHEPCRRRLFFGRRR